jgi:hypothetical protein
MPTRVWISYPGIRKAQFEALVRNSAQVGALSDELIKRIVERRDEREKFLLKSLVFQIALYVALIGAPTDNATITLFGFPFKAVREVCLFLLGILNLLAVFNGMTVRVLNDFLETWQAQKFPSQARALGNVAYPSIFSIHYWAPPPSPPITPGIMVRVISLVIAIIPPLTFFLLFLAGLAAAIDVAHEAWHTPTLQPFLSKSVVSFFVASYLINLFYAVSTSVPLPFKK